MSTSRDCTYSDPTHIEVLEVYEAVRLRPGMYVGDLADGPARVLESFVWAVLEGGAPTAEPTVRVTIENARTVSVVHEGPGAWLEPCGAERRPMVVEAMRTGFVAPPLVLGLGQAQPFCSAVRVDVGCEGRRYQGWWRRGELRTPLLPFGSARKCWARFTFTLDDDIIDRRHGYDLASAVAALEPYMLLRPQRRLDVLHAPTGRSVAFGFPEGPRDVLRGRALTGPVHVATVRPRGLTVKVAWAADARPCRVVATDALIGWNEVDTLRAWLAESTGCEHSAAVLLQRKDGDQTWQGDAHRAWYPIERALNRAVVARASS